VKSLSEMNNFKRDQLIQNVLKPLHGMTVGEAREVLREAEAELDYIKVLPLSDYSSTNENFQE
jgi:hypothetical protein